MSSKGILFFAAVFAIAGSVSAKDIDPGLCLKKYTLNTGDPQADFQYFEKMSSKLVTTGGIESGSQSGPHIGNDQLIRELDACHLALMLRAATETPVEGKSKKKFSHKSDLPSVEEGQYKPEKRDPAAAPGATPSQMPGS